MMRIILFVFGLAFVVGFAEAKPFCSEPPRPLFPIRLKVLPQGELSTLEGLLESAKAPRAYTFTYYVSDSSRWVVSAAETLGWARAVGFGPQKLSAIRTAMFFAKGGFPSQVHDKARRKAARRSYWEWVNGGHCIELKWCLRKRKGKEAACINQIQRLPSRRTRAYGKAGPRLSAFSTSWEGIRVSDLPRNHLRSHDAPEHLLD